MSGTPEQPSREAGPARSRGRRRVLAVGGVLALAALLTVSAVEARSPARPRVSAPVAEASRVCGGTGLFGAFFRPCAPAAPPLRGSLGAAREVDRLAARAPSRAAGRRAKAGAKYVTAYAAEPDRKLRREAQERARGGETKRRDRDGKRRGSETRRSDGAAAAASTTRPGEAAVLYCVRMSDGYLFPAPNSQFVGVENFVESLGRCRSICAGASMDLFELNRKTLDTETMTSLTDGSPYRDLDTAFSYRNRPGFASCDFAAYHQRALNERLAALLPDEVFRGTVPIPLSRPQLPAAFRTRAGAPREIRVVYPPFVADDSYLLRPTSSRR